MSPWQEVEIPPARVKKKEEEGEGKRERERERERGRKDDYTALPLPAQEDPASAALFVSLLRRSDEDRRLGSPSA